MQADLIAREKIHKFTESLRQNFYAVARIAINFLWCVMACERLYFQLVEVITEEN